MRVEQDMALTVAEFFRHLPHALRGYTALAIDDNTVVAEQLGRRVTIRATPLPPRRIGPTVVLPRTLVVLELEGGGEAAFVEQFNRAFQRGGG